MSCSPLHVFFHWNGRGIHGRAGPRLGWLQLPTAAVGGGGGGGAEPLQTVNVCFPNYLGSYTSLYFLPIAEAKVNLGF